MLICRKDDTGLDYRDAAPISGLRFGDGSESMLVSVQVEQ